MYRCCFCVAIITTDNIDPCLIDILININKPKVERYNQIFYCHLKCFEQKLHEKIRFYLALECLVPEDENHSNNNSNLNNEEI